jgi:hypothetical protein
MRRALKDRKTAKLNEYDLEKAQKIFDDDYDGIYKYFFVLVIFFYTTLFTFR